jgi:hypothetical protein
MALADGLALPDVSCNPRQQQALLSAPDTGLVVAHRATMRALVDRGLAEWGPGLAYAVLTERGRFYTDWLRSPAMKRRGRIRPDKGLGPGVVRALVGADSGRQYRIVKVPQKTLNTLYVRRLAQGRPGLPGQHFLTEQGVAARTMLLRVAIRYEQRHESAAVIARDVEVSARTIQRWLIAMGVDIRRVKLTEKQRTAIARKYRRNKGASLATLAAEYDVSTQCIKNVLNARKVTLRPPGRHHNHRPANRQETRHS